MNEVTSSQQQQQQQAKRNSGLFSIFKWFKNSSTSRESVDSLSSSSSLTSSSDSIDSTYSTGTVASFSFVPPHAYQNNVKARNLIPQPETDTYKARLSQREKIKERDKNTTLRKKYNLFFQSDTLLKPPAVVEEDNSKSLPLMTKKVINKEEERMHRRTASESSKIKKAGAYCHVKGKRRAPAPPMKVEETTSSWRRKKRVAPAPPVDETVNKKDEEVIFNDSLKLDHGILKPTKELDKNENQHSLQAQSVNLETPVSPRPWYKRNSRNCDLNIDESRIDRKKEHEKRKSGLSFLTNISELDREATELLKKEKQAVVVNEMPEFMRPKNEQVDTLVSPKRKSAKDLIAKFNAITKGKSSKQQENKKIPLRKSANDTVLNPLMKSESATVIKTPIIDNKKPTPKTERKPWNCPKCSKENEYWRIICSVCSAIKPYFDDLASSSKSNSPSKIEVKTNKIELPGTLERSNTQIGFSALTRYNEQKDRRIERSVSAEGKEDPPAENKKEEREKLMKMIIEMKNSLPKRKLSASKDNKRTSIIEEGLEILDNEEKRKEMKKNVQNKELKPEKQEIKQEKQEMKPEKQEIKLGKQEIKPGKQEIKSEKQEIKSEKQEIKIEKQETKPEIKKIEPQKVQLKTTPQLVKLNSVLNGNEEVKNKEPSPPKKAEAIIITQETVYENIKVKQTEHQKPVKVSSSAQTSAVVRKPMPESVTGAIKKDGRFELMKPADFADIYNEKSGGAKLTENRVYANFDAVKDNMSLFVNMPKRFAELKNNIDATTNNTDTLEINRLLRRLENAIAKGELTDAAIYARELAQLKVNCSVVRQREMKDAGVKKSGEYTVEMFVEDRLSHRGPFPIKVTAEQTVGDLKKQVEREFEIPVAVQRWILGKELATDDNHTLKDHHVITEGCPIFLYLVAPNRDSKIITENNKKPETTTKTEPAIQQPENATKPIVEIKSAKNEVKIVDFKIKEPLQKAESTHIDIKIEEKLIPKKEEVKPSTSVVTPQKVVPKATIEDEDFDDYDCKTLKPQKTDWECRMCTLLNPVTSNICAVCAFVRPTITPRAATRKKTTPAGNNKRKEPPNTQKQHYQQLVNLDSTDLVENTEKFECIVCLTEVEPKDGVTLRECLHQFCKLCLAHTIEFTEEAEVKCPYRDDQYSCDIPLQDREIKALVTPVVYEQYLARSMAQAENKTEKSFHCKTPDCKGWCIFEDNVNDFRCPVCKKVNCLTCQAIHTGMNCKQYQERMNAESEVDEDAKRTREMLEEMVNKGEALTCPACHVILMKKWGCDWVRCSMCKTEICWVTRGPRWGPAGKGDTSGGCKCGVNGVKCHAQCNYCH